MIRKSFIVVLFSMLLCTTAIGVEENTEEAVYRAVIVGIEDYAEINPCTWADEDAREMKETLIDSPQWSNINIKILLDEDATKADIKAAIKWLATDAKEGDVSLFYFAGHGTNDGVDVYICGYNSKPGIKDLSEDIRGDKLAEWMGEIKSQKIAIFDSCYSGGLINSRSMSQELSAPRVKEGTPDVKLTDGVAEKFKATGALGVNGYEVMTACDVIEKAYGSYKLENGVFTYFLLEGLDDTNADSDGDGVVTTKELFDYAEPRTTEYETRQHLQWWDGIEGKDLSVVISE